jgi:hypothetical protein
MEQEYLDKLYNVAAAAKRLGGLSESTIRAYWTKGVLERVKVGGATRVSESGIRDFLRRSKDASLTRPSNHMVAITARLEGLRQSREARKQSKEAAARDVDGPAIRNVSGKVTRR